MCELCKARLEKHWGKICGGPNSGKLVFLFPEKEYKSIMLVQDL